MAAANAGSTISQLPELTVGEIVSDIVGVADSNIAIVATEEPDGLVQRVFASQERIERMQEKAEELRRLMDEYTTAANHAISLVPEIGSNTYLL